MVTDILLQTNLAEQLDFGYGTVVGVVVILVVAYVLAAVTERFLEAIADSLAAERFRVLLVIPILKVVIYAVAAYSIVVITVSPSARQLLAFSGLFGAALGFGFKELVNDVLGGLAILVERPYRMGDKVSIGSHYGEVVNIGLRSTQVMTLDDDLVTIPNHVFFKESIVNSTDGNAEMLVTIDFYIDVTSDPRIATRLVEEAIVTSRYVYVTDDYPVAIRLEDNPTHYTITGKAYVNDTRNEGAFRSDVTERTLAAFHDHDIDQPRVVPEV